jgi:hypothetical protein
VGQAARLDPFQLNLHDPLFWDDAPQRIANAELSY